MKLQHCHSAECKQLHDALQAQLVEANKAAAHWMGEANFEHNKNVGLQARCGAAELDTKRIEWLSESPEAHHFCYLGDGDHRYYAHQENGYKTVREVIDAAMKETK